MYRKNLMRVCLAAIMAATVVTTSVPVYAAEPVATKQETKENVKVGIEFVNEDGIVVKGEWLHFTEGTHSYSELESHVPDGYKISQSGDWSATEGAKISVNIVKKEEQKPEKPAANVKVGVEFVNEDGIVVKGEWLYFTEGTHSYSELESHVPDGYKISQSGDWSATEGAKISVNIVKKEEQKPEKPAANVKVGVEFVNEDGIVVKGEWLYFTEGTHNYSELESHVPDGYKISQSGDWSATEGAKISVNIVKKEEQKPEKPAANVKVGVEFVNEDGIVVKGEWLYFTEGTHSYSELESHVPDGYKISQSGDWSATEGAKISVNIVKKIENLEVTLNVSFVTKDGEKVASTVCRKEVQGSTNDLYAFTLGKDFLLPDNYKLAEGEKTQFDVPFGATSAATIVVEKNVEEKTVYVSYIDEETKKPFENGIEEIKLPADANSFNASILKKVPAGYEVCVTGDITFEGDTVNVEVRKAEKTVYVSYIDEETKKPFENGIEEIKLPADANSFNASILKKVPAGYEVCVTGDIAFEGDTVNVEVRKAEKTVYVSYIDEETKKPFENGIEEIKLPADANSFNASILKKVPAGYEVCVTGDIAFEGDTVNVEVRKAEKTVYVSYIDEETKKPFENGIEEIKLPADANSFNASILKKVPAGYEVCVTGDIAFEGDTVNVEVRKAEKTVYVSYIDEETKKPFENGIEEIKLPADANSFNASILKKVPAGYEVCVTGDIAFEGDTVNVEVRKAEKTVYVSYIDEETKMPFENGIEEIKLPADANSFNTSILKKVPAGYEVCVTGDIAFEGDTVNVEVRKLAAEEKTVYVSYIDEETKMPFENGIETIKLAKNATYFNTSLLKEVPAGYELCEVGDVYIGENDTVNVEVRKIKEEPETPVDPDKPVNPEKPEKPEKPVKPQEDDKDKDNQKDDKKDEDDKKSPKTSDEASPLAATATAGLSLAAILALLKKRR